MPLWVSAVGVFTVAQVTDSTWLRLMPLLAVAFSVAVNLAAFGAGLYFRMTANNDGTLTLRGPWGRKQVDLRAGYEVVAMRAKRIVVLRAGATKVRLVGFGTLEEVAGWLDRVRADSLRIA
jgi:hypothetical protein